MTDPYVTLKVARAGNTNDNVKRTVRNLMSDNTTYQKHYFAGVNADFFGSSTCGTCVADGVYVSAGATMSNEKLPNQFIIDKNGVPTIATDIQLNGSVDPGWMVHTDETLGTVTLPNGHTENSVRFNTNTRWEGYMVAYTEDFMKLDYDKVHTEIDASGNTIKENGENKQFPNQTGYTSQNHWGVEVALVPVAGQKFIIGEPVEYVATKVTQSGTGGNMKVPKGGLVLSGANCSNAEHPFNAAKGKLDQVKVGDKITLNFPFTADGVAMTCRETAGGFPRIVTNNNVITSVPTTPTDLALSKRRARTAVGYNADKTKMYIFVVEESALMNDGMTVKALGNLMQAMGCHEALNFDGGGSSVLHVENLGQRSDVQGSSTYQRPVMNGLFAVTEAPEDREVARIEFVDKALTIKPGRGYQPVIYAYNKYGVLISAGLKNYTLSAPEATFDATKRKMIAPESGYFALTATYNGITTSIPVKVDAAGVSGSDPATAPSFSSGAEITSIPEKPADWVDPNQPNLHVIGKFNNWDKTQPLVVHPNTGSNGIYEFDIHSSDSDDIQHTYFKMTTIDPSRDPNAFTVTDQTWHINNDVEGGKDKPDSDILGNGIKLDLIEGNANNIKTPWNGNWHFVVDLGNKTITATTDTPRPAVEAANVSLVAEIDGEDMVLDLEGSDGIYKAKNINITGTALSFLVDGVAYGPAVNGTKITDTDDYYVSPANEWTVDAGPYNVTFNTVENTVTVIRQVYAILQDVTPAGYDFDKYEPGTVWKFAELPTTSTSGTWTAPAGIYTQSAMDKDGHVTAIHVRGADMSTHHGDGDAKTYIDDKIKGFTIQKHPSENVGNCLVYTQQWSPGNSVYSWPSSTNNTRSFQVTFYADPTKINGKDADHPVRFRMVLQVLYRGRHAQDDAHSNEITSIYTSGFNAGSAWATSYNGIGDNDIAAAYPIDHRSFYKWENEGTTIASIPEVKTFVDGTGVKEPWDADGTTNPYLMNGDRFMVYEYDIYGGHENGSLAVHVNFNTTPWTTFVFKEIKFYNVLNQDELMGKKKAASAPAKVSAAEKAFRSSTVPGSLIGTRAYSYRYYTPDGLAEFQQEEMNTGVDNVVVDDNADAPVEYYNLQGVRVENPAPGLYIKRQGTPATKVIIR
ncbi:MAG: phosphodiester glycosidase family protein [Muribaculaceae bacterium]|nr:phosphodiester glycosidase family protein [Muribaculaceae bacterium]